VALDATLTTPMVLAAVRNVLLFIFYSFYEN
jgi:hypothetical protein